MEQGIRISKVLSEMEKRILSSNKKAYYNYEIFEKLETGVVLFGHEVKSLKQFKVSLANSIVKFFNGEAFIENMFIAPYEHVSTHVIDYDSKRERKLLMHRSEIIKIHAKVKGKGFTAIPLEIYVDVRGKVKILIGLAKGKKIYDKREAMKKRDFTREIAREY
ncbi:MAG: SsrA-binding protein SmpB [Endomicrobium sp.]|jgi:SsrA-binding protein|nr:SsrA-binding protein SmpB [Endomicrobium sp.]